MSVTADGPECQHVDSCAGGCYDFPLKSREMFGCLIAYSERVALLLLHVSFANGSRC